MSRLKLSTFLLLGTAVSALACGGSGTPVPPDGPSPPPARAPEAPITLPAPSSPDALELAVMEKIRENLPPQVRQVLDMKNTAEQLQAILQEPCLGEQDGRNRVYSIDMASPQVRGVQAYSRSQSAEVPFQESFRKIGGIIGSGNGHFSQAEAEQICDELNAVIEEAQGMIDEAASVTGGPMGGPGPPGGPRPPR